MKINFDTPILSIDGKPIKKDADAIFTLRDVCVSAILADTPEVQKMDAKTKRALGHLADRIFGCKEPINLPAEDIVLLKDAIPRAYGVLTTTRALDILDGEDEPPAGDSN